MKTVPAKASNLPVAQEIYSNNMPKNSFTDFKTEGLTMIIYSE